MFALDSVGKNFFGAERASFGRFQVLSPKLRAVYGLKAVIAYCQCRLHRERKPMCSGRG